MDFMSQCQDSSKYTEGDLRRMAQRLGCKLKVKQWGVQIFKNGMVRLVVRLENGERLTEAL